MHGALAVKGAFTATIVKGLVSDAHTAAAKITQSTEDASQILIYILYFPCTKSSTKLLRLLPGRKAGSTDAYRF
jgi:hypothetical protein